MVWPCFAGHLGITVNQWRRCSKVISIFIKIKLTSLVLILCIGYNILNKPVHCVTSQIFLVSIRVIEIYFNTNKIVNLLNMFTFLTNLMFDMKITIVIGGM